MNAINDEKDLNKINRILIYKRTHTGDPNECGLFGINDCMGSFRDYNYDAVIGVGADETVWEEEIRKKLTWIGIGPHRIQNSKIGGRRAFVYRFDHFCLFDKNGELLEKHAPNLANRMYGPHSPRFLITALSDKEKKEARGLLAWAWNQPDSRSQALIDCAEHAEYCISTELGCTEEKRSCHSEQVCQKKRACEGKC